MSTRPVIKRGTQCDHTEHANASGGYASTLGGYFGRYFTDQTGSEGEWESCPNEPSRGSIARAEALLVGATDWWERTSWNPVKDRPIGA